jgi:hypothetical protein
MLLLVVHTHYWQAAGWVPGDTRRVILLASYLLFLFLALCHCNLIGCCCGQQSKVAPARAC